VVLCFVWVLLRKMNASVSSVQSWIGVDDSELQEAKKLYMTSGSQSYSCGNFGCIPYVLCHDPLVVLRCPSLTKRTVTGLTLYHKVPHPRLPKVPG
jgi:hypothetical protein